MPTYEVIIRKYSSIKVEAGSKVEARRRANEIINIDEEIDEIREEEDVT